MDRESPGIIIPVPADNIERMCFVRDRMDMVLFLDPDHEIAVLVVGFEVARENVIALAIRRMLGELPEMVAVPFGRVNGRV
ncbi:hypothetical protein D3C87_1919880 [compost metagenome]